MIEEKMNWRSFAYREEINDKWNPSTPSDYMLDRKGVIRHKWVDAPSKIAIDTVLEKLINEEVANGQKPAKWHPLPGSGWITSGVLNEDLIPTNPERS